MKITEALSSGWISNPVVKPARSADGSLSVELVVMFDEFTPRSRFGYYMVPASVAREMGLALIERAAQAEAAVAARLAAGSS